MNKDFFTGVEQLLQKLKNDLNLTDLSVDFNFSPYREGKVNAWFFFTHEGKKITFNIQFNAFSKKLDIDFYDFLRLAIEFNIKQHDANSEVISYEL